MAGLIGCANYGHNKELMKKCPMLGEYSHFVAVSREYLAQGMERQEAYEAAINYCIEHDILKKYLRENRMEVIGMLLKEFDVEKYERTIREEGREAGLAEAGGLIRRLLSQSNIKDLDLEDSDRELLREMGI